MIKIVSSDLNGTLVHQHTMSDMIRLYIGEKEFRIANDVFKRQTAGKASMEEAFSTAGPQTKGLTLRQAIRYTFDHMNYVDGFHDFVTELHQRKIPFVINSTGYSVSIHAIRATIGQHKIHGYIGNILEFGLNGDSASALREDELEQKVKMFCAEPEAAVHNFEYDQIKAIGVVHLGIHDEAAKAQLLFAYIEKHFSDIKKNEIAHIGDTMGDSGGILGVAQEGGTGITFNYNDALEQFLRNKIAENPALENHLLFIDKKETRANLRKLIPYLQ